MLTVDPIRAHEIEKWCAAPYTPADPGFDAWIEGERAWIEANHPTPRNLWICRKGPRVVGKIDVAFELPHEWTLWAPTVRRGPAAKEAMDVLLARVLAEARERGVSSVELLLEQNHPGFETARAALEAGEWGTPQERILVRRDLTRPLPAPPPGLRVDEAKALSAEVFRTLVEQVGLEMEPVAEILAEFQGNPLSLAAYLPDGRAVGLALASSEPGLERLTEEHLGLVPDARGRGLGWSLLLQFLRAGRRAGASTYLGSTAATNGAMRRLFERAGADVIGTRLAFRWSPDTSA